MASSSLHSNLTSPVFLSPKRLNPKTPPPKTLFFPIRSGPRSNRGPLLKGRILSTEAILAIQSLKRAYNKNKSSSTLDPTNNNLPNLTRLIKLDLVSIIRELLRQDFCSLALHAFSTLRSEYPLSVDLNMYADVIISLAKNNMMDEIDGVIGEMERGECGVQWGSDKGLIRVVRGVVEAGRRESTVKICEMMRRNGCGDTWTADEYVVKVLSNGLRRMGEVELGGEVERKFGGVSRGSLERLKL